MEQTTRGRQLWLDALRIFAAAAVVALHSMNGFITSPAMVGSLTWYGCLAVNAVVRAGVPLFLMISGCLILSDARTADFASFYKKRLTRILLPFLVWDVIYFLVHLLTEERTYRFGDFLRELLNNGSEYHFWYVYTIAAIYLFAPFLRILVERCSPKAILWLWVLAAFTGTIRPLLNTVQPVYIFLFDPLVNGYFSYFLLGYLLGNVELNGKLRALFYAGGVIGLAYGIFANAAASSAESVNLVANGGYAFNQHLTAAAFFVLAKYAPVFRGKTTGKRTAAVSGVTYGVYLAHVLVLNLIVPHIPAIHPALTMAISFAAAFFVPTAVMLLVSRIRPAAKFLM